MGLRSMSIEHLAKNRWQSTSHPPTILESRTRFAREIHDCYATSLTGNSDFSFDCFLRALFISSLNWLENLSFAHCTQEPSHRYSLLMHPCPPRNFCPLPIPTRLFRSPWHSGVIVIPGGRALRRGLLPPRRIFERLLRAHPPRTSMLRMTV